MPSGFGGNRKGELMKRLQVMFVAILAITFMAAASQQQKQTKKQKDTPLPEIAQTIPEQIDNNIGEMLGAWQVGDVEAMHKYYADDATFTSGAYEVPIIGWKNYVDAYQKQRARIQAMSLIRRNTNIFFRTDFAWATYQWELSGVVDNQSMSAKGQTTLVFALTNGHWLIVHNHTSEICGSTVTGPVKSDQQMPSIGDQKSPAPTPTPK